MIELTLKELEHYTKVSKDFFKKDKSAKVFNITLSDKEDIALKTLRIRKLEVKE